MNLLSVHSDYLIFAGFAISAFAFIQWRLRQRQARMGIGVWLLVGGILGVGWWVADDAGNCERNRIEALVGGIAPPYAAALRAMGHEKITPDTAPDDPDYLAMIEAEKHWLQANQSAHDIFTMRKLPDGTVVLLVDSETDYNRDGIYSGDREQRTPIGEVYPVIDPGLGKALAGEANFYTQPVTDRWGTWVTAWTPLYDMDGKMEAVLGVDYAAKDWLGGIAAARGLRIAQIGVLLALLGSSVYVNGMLRADLEHRRRTEESLRHSQGRLALRAEQSPLAVIEWDLNLRVVDWNAAAERLFGYSRAEVMGVAMLDRLASAPVRARIAGLRDGRADGRAAEPSTDTLVTKDGRRIECEWLNAALMDGGVVIGVTSLCEDISQRRKIEEQLREVQKMEAFGQLAGGVAHEFNNKLVSIMGFTELVRQRADVPDDAIADLAYVSAAAEHAAGLTRQLLTFSQRNVFQAVKMDLNAVVTNVSQMLRGVLGDGSTFATDLAADLPPILADPGMIEQALVNLAMNSRDAMPQGGCLMITTSARPVGREEAALHPDTVAGPFVCLEIADNGCGIAPEHLPRIYDPFFTTKEVGRGTGLGLATVHGIVRQHNGWIAVESAPACGTTFRIFLPALATADAAPASKLAAPPARGGHETILVVEDEDPVREFVARLLRENGYEVLTAASGTEALVAWERERDRIDLLLTDMMLPDGLSGADIALRLREEEPELKILFSSGYSADFVSGKVVLMSGVNFLPKPYQPEKLIRVVRENLDRESAAIVV